MLRRSSFFVNLWHHKSIINNESLKCRSSSSAASPQTKENVKASSETIADLIEEDERETLADRRKSDDKKKLPPRLPLAKNFFVGLVDRELLAFPEVVPRDDMIILQNEILPLKNYFNDDLVSKLQQQNINTTKNEEKSSIPQNIEDNLKDLNLYGLNVSKDYNGGKGWGYSASLMASEPECRVPSLGMGLANHRAIIDVLEKAGTQAQRDYFLPLLANGSLLASEAIYEMTVPEDDLFNTKATFDASSRQWILNGSKSFVITSPKPSGSRHLFLVLAQTQELSVNVEIGQLATLFLVDSEQPGVEILPAHNTTGCHNARICTVNFKNVSMDENRILGDLNHCNPIADDLQASTRLRSSLVALGLSKEIMNDLISYCTNKVQYGVLLKDSQSVQAYLGSSTASIYGMESMIYFTAGLLDEFDGPDVTLEAAITKYFCLKELLSIGVKSLELYGCRSALVEETSAQRFRDAIQLYTNTESIDVLTVSIAIMGLEHSGKLLGDNIRKQRNPLYNPGYIFKKLFEKSNIDHPNTKMRLNENVHPTLEAAAVNVEHSVARLQMCVELMLARFGSELVEEHTVTRRLADMVTYIYYMYTSLSRASRSYCIGLPQAEYEMLMALTVCMGSNERVRNLATELFNGLYANNDNHLFRLSKQVFKNKEYFPSHPLMYNF